jgi:hypothetical protein
MRRYQAVSLMIIAAGAAFVGGLRFGEHRGAAAARAATGAGGSCCGTVKSVGAPEAKPPAIPTGSGRPCLVEFGSDECSECQRMAVVLAEVTPKLRGTVDVVRVDTDVHPSQAQRWQLRMVPTQLFVDAQGQEQWRHEGYVATGELMAKIKGATGRTQ